MMRIPVLVLVFLIAVFSSCHTHKKAGEHMGSGSSVSGKASKKQPTTSDTGNNTGISEANFAKTFNESSVKKVVVTDTRDTKGRGEYPKGLMADGRIPLYHFVSHDWTTSPSGHLTRSRSDHYYVRPSPGDPLKTITYRHLRPLMTPGTFEYKMLQRHEKWKIASWTLGISTLGLFGAGVHYGTIEDSKMAAKASTYLVASVLTFAGYMVAHLSNKHRLMKAVLIADDYNILDGSAGTPKWARHLHK